MTYAFDKVGNRLSQTVNGVETKYTYNDNDQVLTAGNITYTYNANGNTLTKIENGNTIKYSYDKQNKLIKVDDGGIATQFRYNPNGLRIGKQSGTDSIDYLIDGQSGFGDVVAEYKNGTKVKTYTIGHRRISQTMGADTFYFGVDNQGSVKFLSNSTGLTDEYSYDSFGVLKNQTGTTDNDFKYTGEQYDDTLDMYNLRARYYQPEIGRFYGLDTYQGQLSDPESLHKYLYTSNDPINMIDPTGQFVVGSMNVSMNIAVIGALGATASYQIMNTAFSNGITLGDRERLSNKDRGWLLIASMSGAGSSLLDKVIEDIGSDTSGAVVMYHGSDPKSITAFLNGATLDSNAAINSKYPGEGSIPGFYLTADVGAACFFGARREGTAMEFVFTLNAYAAIKGVSTINNGVRIGNFYTFEEMIVPLEAFPLFNGLIASGQIKPQYNPNVCQ